MTSARGLHDIFIPGPSIITPRSTCFLARRTKTLLRLSTVALALSLGASCTSSPPVYTENFDEGALCWTSNCDKNHAGDFCAPGELDHSQFYSAATSIHLYQKASCFSPPYDGVTSSLSKTIPIPNGTYRLSYQVRNITHHYDYCIGNAGGRTDLSANGVRIDGVACRVNRCDTCTEDWSPRQGCFNVTEGTANLVISSHSDDCAETDAWVDDIALAPLESLEVQFPADVTVVCNALTGPAETGTASTTGGCDPQVSYTDVVEGGCPGTITRTWKVVDAGATRTQVQIITLLDPDGDDDGVNDATDLCPNTPAGSIVDERGCTCEPRVELACPPTATWKNHGAYVSCVSGAANLCMVDGLINEAAKDEIVAAAARSDIGKNRK